LLMASTKFWQGSSPHTRGAPATWRGRNHDVRIIPAYAGSTRPGAVPSREGWDHPRIRGEHARTSGARERRAGSSPHTRGARSSRRRLSKALGIIPAYAGSTAYNALQRPGWGDHPRIRGEHARRGRTGPGRAGSSPHTRGALVVSHPILSEYRIIPAYAGSTGRTRMTRI